jgi:hypothetical protein
MITTLPARIVRRAGSGLEKYRTYAEVTRDCARYVRPQYVRSTNLEYSAPVRCNERMEKTIERSVDNGKRNERLADAWRLFHHVWDMNS